MTSRLRDRDFGYADIVRSLRDLRRTSVFVGVRAEQGEDLVTYAAANELGAPGANVPERSYLRSTVDKHQQRYERELTVAVRELVSFGVRAPGARYADYRRRLELLGVQVVGDVQAQIRELRPPAVPALKAATILRKGSDKPLIDTGRLRQSIEYFILDGRQIGETTSVDGAIVGVE